jgi:hypothetical protein
MDVKEVSGGYEFSEEFYLLLSFQDVDGFSHRELAGLYTRVKEMLDLPIADIDSLPCRPTNNALLSARNKGAFS